MREMAMDVETDVEQRRGRCPDGGYCHGSTLAAGSEPCAPGACYRVQNAGPLSGVYPGDRWPDEVRRPRAVRELFRAADQEAVSDEAAAVLAGPVSDVAHGVVQAELRQVQVSVRGQMDGIRPIEAAVLSYRWTAARLPETARDVPSSRWVFEELQPLVQGMDGTLKPGTVLSAEDLRMLGQSLGWAWDLVQRNRPRG